MKAYDQIPSFEKNCFAFLCNPNDFYFLCDYGRGKEKRKKCTMLNVVMFGYGKGPTHWICSHV